MSVIKKYNTRTFIIKHFKIGYWSPDQHPDQHLQSQKEFMFSIHYSSPCDSSGCPVQAHTIQAPSRSQTGQKSTFTRTQKDSCHHLTINPEPDRSDRCKANREKQMAEESEGGRRDCMPLTVTFPVFFYAHTFRQSSQRNLSSSPCSS